MKKIGYLVTIILVLGIAACKKNSSINEKPATVNIHLADDPGAYQHVYLDIEAIQVTIYLNSVTDRIHY